jgi:tetratricopeptide (TPR) repeat protein
MLETVRAYAAHELSAAGEREEALEGLARYTVTRASNAEQGLVGAQQANWLDGVRDDLENYRASMTWLIERGRPAEACEIAWGLGMFWLIRGHASEGLRWYEQVLKLPALTPVVESKALIGAALLMYSVGELKAAGTEIGRAWALAESANDTVLAAHARTITGHIAHAAGQVSDAREQFARAAETFQQFSIEWARGSALSGKGGVALAMGDVAEAERLLDEATRALRDSGPWFLMPVRCFRAVLAVHRGQADEAIALMRQSLIHIRELHDKYAFVYALVPLAAGAMLKGDAARAARFLGARAAVSERTGARVVVKVIQDIGDRAERDARSVLGVDRFATAFGAGRTASIDALLKDIDRAEYSNPSGG